MAEKNASRAVATATASRQVRWGLPSALPPGDDRKRVFTDRLNRDTKTTSDPYTNSLRGETTETCSIQPDWRQLIRLKGFERCGHLCLQGGRQWATVKSKRSFCWSTSPARRRCAARWACGTGWSRRRRRCVNRESRDLVFGCGARGFGAWSTARAEFEARIANGRANRCRTGRCGGGHLSRPSLECAANDPPSRTLCRTSRSLAIEG